MTRQSVFGAAMLGDLIKSYADTEGTSEQSTLRDLLTDLRHVAANKGLDFDLAVEGAVEVFNEEFVEESQSQTP